ncbi:hypothetical protein Y032_0011g1498 [Ancylostoma ceylanicum]|uniref:Uncharacterized protein n=1 Tax=Ancylostoma ceylanicum TaxID=53326 RepID=A0A016VEZ9_9BILA|nr:hypothetical protein Y032_0011g1498 [Ancylostoma ceylanicum]
MGKSQEGFCDTVLKVEQKIDKKELEWLRGKNERVNFCARKITNNVSRKRGDTKSGRDRVHRYSSTRNKITKRPLYRSPHAHTTVNFVLFNGKRFKMMEEVSEGFIEETNHTEYKFVGVYAA